MKISKIYKQIRDNIIYRFFILFSGKNFRIHSLIIGGQRCASTSMISFLSSLENIVTPKNNEQLYFFSDYYDKSNNFKKYHIKFLSNFFKKKGKNKIFLEKTPEYCLEEQYLDRILDYNKDIKLIFIFREPYSRIRSSYELYKKLNYKGDFKTFISDDEKKYNVLKFSKYKEIYKKIFSRFNFPNVLLINFDEINSEITRLRLSKFLGIEINIYDFPKSNSFKLINHDLDYKSIIKNVHGEILDEDYEDFLRLFKEYEIKFKNFYKY